MISSKQNRRLVILFLTFFLVPTLIGGGAYFSGIGIDWPRLKIVFEVVQSLATILAIVFGAVWTYYNFIKGKIYQPRLEAKISGKIIKRGGVDYLIVTSQLKNIGITEINLSDGCAIIVSFYKPAQAAPLHVNDAIEEELETIPVFGKRVSVMFGATSEEQSLLELPAKEPLAFRIQLRVVYNDKELITNTVVEYPTKTTEQELTVHVKGINQS